MIDWNIRTSFRIGGDGTTILLTNSFQGEEEAFETVERQSERLVTSATNSSGA
jgi:hypothetical protein